MPLDLYIQNEKLERIGRVNVHGAALQGVERLVISTFTREPKVLGKTWGRLMRIVCEGDSKHFVGFGKYLHERGKAAEIHHNAHKIIILPPSSAGDVGTWFECLTDLPDESVTESAQAQRAAESKSSGPGDFLSNILSRIDKQTPVPKPALAVDMEAKREQRRREMEEFEEQTREEITEFVADAARTELHFPPMEKPMRSIIHGIVADFKGLLSGSAGETPEERHIVVYKEGFQPADIDVHLDKSRIIHLSNKRVSAPPKVIQGAAAPPQAIEHLQETKYVKRDRRTVAELQAELLERNKRRRENDSES